ELHCAHEMTSTTHRAFRTGCEGEKALRPGQVEWIIRVPANVPRGASCEPPAWRLAAFFMGVHASRGTGLGTADDLERSMDIILDADGDLARRAKAAASTRRHNVSNEDHQE